MDGIPTLSRSKWRINKRRFLSFPGTPREQEAGCLQAAFWYLEEYLALAGLSAKSPLGPAAGRAPALARRAGNEMGAGGLCHSSQHLFA